MANPSNYIETLAERLEPALREAFLAAVQEIRGRAPIEAIAAMIERGDIDGVWRALDIEQSDFAQVQRQIESAFDAGGSAAVRDIPALKVGDGSRLIVRFDVRNQRAEEWLRTHSSRLVVEIIEDQRVALRTALSEGMQAGRNPKRTALDLVGRVALGSNERQGGIVGLTSQQQGYLSRYEQELASEDPVQLRKALSRALRDKRFDRTVEKAIRDGKPVPAETAAKMRTSYSNKMLRWRGETIARTETLTALNEGQREAYRQGIDKGVIEQQDVRRFWKTAMDERVRHWHRTIPTLNKAGVGMDEPFQTERGPVMLPPAGPNCRCRVEHKVDFLARVVRENRRG